MAAREVGVACMAEGCTSEPDGLFCARHRERLARAVGGTFDDALEASIPIAGPSAYERAVADHMPGGATYEAAIAKADRDANTTLYRDGSAALDRITGLSDYIPSAVLDAAAESAVARFEAAKQSLEAAQARVDYPPAAVPAMIGVGAWRLYFNRHGAAGLPWCVAPDGGGWELAVVTADVRVPSTTVYAPKATPDDEDGRPSAWIACTGRLTVTAAGAAVIAEP